RRGGVFGGAGLEGFTGIGGGFGTVSTQSSIQTQQASNANFGVAGGAGAGEAGGYIGLVQRQQEIRNAQSNVAALGGSVTQLDAAYAAGRIDKFQVDLARQAFYNAQSRLMTDITNYQNLVDNFKVTFGMPPQLTMLIRDQLLEPFQLIDARLAPLQNRMTQMQAHLGDLIVPLREDARDPAAFGAAQFRKRVSQLRQALSEALEVHSAVIMHLPEVRQDIAEFRENVPQRRESLELLLRRARKGLSGDNPADAELDRIAETEFFSNPDAIRSDIQRLDGLPDKLDDDLRQIQAALDKIQPVLAALESELRWLEQNGSGDNADDTARRLNAVLSKIPDELLDLYGYLLELSLVQARARTEKIVLMPIDMDSNEAIRIARCNRLDWMNARATLVDRWRLIEFNANALESELNLSINGDVRNASDTPFAFNNSTGQLQMGVQFDAPLTRLAERNNYRQALIEYQQARRDYYNFTDRVAQSLRITLRQIELDQANFELRRAAVRVAIDQVDITQMRLREPPLPGATTQFSNTTARDLVSALSDLLNVQNDFLSVWVNYEVQRVILDFNLETMQLDQFGMWVDPGSSIGEQGKACFGQCYDDEDTLHAADARCNRLLKMLRPGEEISPGATEDLPAGTEELPAGQAQPPSPGGPKREMTND
ncbi:MAG: TolC family protein, partial [Pirellulales bacterium]|nr:TolC family protein [Pirellulales bacterium]